MAEHLTARDDAAKHEQSPDFWRAQFTHIIGVFESACKWFREKQPRREKELVFHNILASAGSYMHLLGPGVVGPIQAIAVCARGLFELNLRAKYLLLDAKHIQAYAAQAASGQVKVYRALIKLADPVKHAGEVQRVKAEIDRLAALAEKHGLPGDARPEKWANMAQAVNLKEEYDAFYDLSSQLVHPSSFLVNQSQTAFSVDTRITMLLLARYYASELMECVRREFGIPEAVLKS